MIGSFVFLITRRFKNRFLHRLRRLKEVRYLLGAIIGFTYFAFVFTRGSHGRGYQRLTENIAAPFILGLLIVLWILPALSSVAFSEEELHFIIGGPVTRRQVLLYKLMNSQFPILIATLIATFLGVPNGGVIGFWVTYSVIGIYSMFVAIARKKMTELGLPSWWISFAAFAALVGMVVAFFQFHFRPAPLLFVPRLIVRPLFAKTPVAIATASAIAALVGAAFFLIASSLRVDFEELVQTASERIARFRARQQRQPGEEVSFRRLGAPFRLKPGAPPEVAIVWKNSIAVVRMALSGVIIVLVFAILFLAGAILFEDDGLKAMCSAFAIAAAVIFPLLGSMMLKQDYRLDVTRVDVLKTWPIAGERLVAAEVAAPLLMMSILEVLLVINAAVTASIAAGQVLKFVTPQAVVIALMFAIPICALQLMLRNTVAIVFPGWGFRSREEQRGFVAVGQRLLGAIINLVALSVFLAPAAAVCAISLWIVTRFTAGGAALLAALTMPAVFVLVLELWLILKVLGAQYDKLDIGKDLEPSAM